MVNGFALRQWIWARTALWRHFKQNISQIRTVLTKLYWKSRKMTGIILFNLCSTVLAFDLSHHLTNQEFSPDCSNAFCSRCMAENSSAALTLSCKRLIFSGCCVDLYVPDIRSPEELLACSNCTRAVFSSTNFVIGCSLIVIFLCLKKYFYLTKRQFQVW